MLADDFPCNPDGVACAELPLADGVPAGSASLELAFAFAQHDDRRDVAFALGLGLPLWRLLGDAPVEVPVATRASGEVEPDDDASDDPAAVSGEGAEASPLGSPVAPDEEGETALLGVPARDAAQSVPAQGTPRLRLRRAWRAAPRTSAPARRAHKAKGGDAELAGLSSGTELASGPPAIGPGDVQRVLEAVAAAHADAPLRERLDDLAARARYSSALPEVRLRAARRMDESETLSPTAYDPERVTASGGASLWLEARATFRLDRAVFADEEVRIERLREAQEERADRRRDEVLRLLFAWQRSLLGLARGLPGSEECWSAWVEEQELAAALDAATRGWFASFRRARLPQTASCDVPLDAGF